MNVNILELIKALPYKISLLAKIRVLELPLKISHLFEDDKITHPHLQMPMQDIAFQETEMNISN